MTFIEELGEKYRQAETDVIENVLYQLLGRKPDNSDYGKIKKEQREGEPNDYYLYFGRIRLGRIWWEFEGLKITCRFKPC